MTYSLPPIMDAMRYIASQHGFYIDDVIEYKPNFYRGRREVPEIVAMRLSYHEMMKSSYDIKIFLVPQPIFNKRSNGERLALFLSCVRSLNMLRTDYERRIFGHASGT